MGNFDTFADISEHRRMFADDVARANGSKTNSTRNAFAGMAFAAIDGAVLQIFVNAPAIASPIANAVPDGASTLCLWCASMISISV